jgi:hypothetical protein
VLNWMRPIFVLRVLDKTERGCDKSDFILSPPQRYHLPVYTVPMSDSAGMSLKNPCVFAEG